MPMNMNYKQFNVTYFNYLDDCRIAYARKVDEFVALDISDWMRDWVNGFGSRTIAILFDGGAPGKTVKADAVDSRRLKLTLRVNVHACSLAMVIVSSL